MYLFISTHCALSESVSHQSAEPGIIFHASISSQIKINLV